MRQLDSTRRPPDASSGKILVMHEYEATGETLREFIDAVKLLHAEGTEIEIHPGFIRVNVWHSKEDSAKMVAKQVEKATENKKRR